MVGKRLSVRDSASRCRARSIRSSESLAVVQGETRVEPDRGCALAQQAGADGMEGAGPGQAGGEGVGPFPSASAEMRPTRRIISAAARREKVSSRMRRGSAPREDQVRHPMGERAGLAGAGAGDHQQRSGDPTVAVQHRAQLRLVQPLQMGGWDNRLGALHACIKHGFWFVRKRGPAALTGFETRRGPMPTWHAARPWVASAMSEFAIVSAPTLSEASMRLGRAQEGGPSAASNLSGRRQLRLVNRGIKTNRRVAREALRHLGGNQMKRLSLADDISGTSAILTDIGLVQ